MMVTKGKISFKIEGYFKNERNKKLNMFLSSSEITLDNSRRFIKIIKRDIIIKFIIKYLLVNLKR